MEINKWIKDYMEDVKKNIINNDLCDNIRKSSEIIRMSRVNNNKIIFAGNGASTLIANHGALDYVNQLGIQTLSISSPEFITATSNDFGYEDIFTRYINLYAKRGDIFIAISSSGRSKNVINASKRAKVLGCHVITFSGFDNDNPLRSEGDVNFYVNSNEYNKVESIHNLWLVSICDFILKDEKYKVGVHGLEF